MRKDTRNDFGHLKIWRSPLKMATLRLENMIVGRFLQFENDDILPLLGRYWNWLPVLQPLT